MAIQAVVIAILPWDDTTTSQLEIDYDDIDLRVRMIRVVNPAPRGLTIAARRINGSRAYSTIALPNQTTAVAIATNPANRLQLSLRPDGKLDGVEYSTAWVGL